MKHVAIDVYQDAQQSLGKLTVAEALKNSPELNHAGANEIQQLLEYPDEKPDLLLEKSENGHTNTLLFCGDIYTHENKSEYVIAVYWHRLKGFVTEKYWLADLLPTNIHFALAM